MTQRLTGEVVLVTGAAGGIGSAVATVAAREGAVVAGVDLVEPEVTGCAAFVRADVSREEDVTRAVAELADRLGPPTVLVNNAGVNAHSDRSP
ncbi:SDR family NAD(P)-dependent oxidoreductase [Nonomuraea sp. NPDC050451]|uniref:SDR family NAD(P)-dependent oxidoreductase n=1 Tax=Nonomuraea sp. NPDC050451 TaxID=3364364 RepID=UPI0037BDD44D